MTFADLIYKGFVWMEGRYTRILGLAAGSLGIIAASTDVVPKAWLPKLLMVIGLLTYWRGQSTGATYLQAKAVLSANPIPPVKPASSVEISK